MTTTVNQLVPFDAWKQVSAGSTNVLLQGVSFGYRYAIGTAAPASLTDGVLASSPDGATPLGNLAGSDNVYVIAVSAGIVLPGPTIIGVVAS